MSRPQVLECLIPLAYLIGSIPFGLIVGLSRGIDPRKDGSGNIGATNLGRLLGKRFFALVFTLDLLKGALPMLVAGWILGFRADDRTTYCLWIAVGAAALVGHSFSVFLKFKGGKGVSTSTGVAMAMYPYLTIPIFAAIVVFLIVFKWGRYVSLASILGSSVIPIIYIGMGLLEGWPILGAQLPVLVLAILVPGLIIYRHRGNIARLRAGT
jgi:acyl phosphate:glycerol-3-phosphate acyltransferase